MAHVHLVYFQNRPFPSVIQDRDSSIRLSRVASVFASPIQTLYSFWNDADLLSKMALIAGLADSVLAKAAGMPISFGPSDFFFGSLMPRSLSDFASLIQEISYLSGGRSLRLVNLPIKRFAAGSSSLAFSRASVIRESFQ
jgi:hypothetical protein